MSKKKAQNIENNELRRRAEELVGKNTETALFPGAEEVPLRLYHELQVHQVELDMQNEELRQSRNELEKLLDEYRELYDFAPVGYVTLNLKGTILKVNLTGAVLLGVERSWLVGMGFGLFVTYEARHVFTAFLEKVFTSPNKEECELVLLKKGNAPVCVQVVGKATKPGQECRIALIDITERKRSEVVIRLANEALEALCQAKEAEDLTHLVKEAAELLRQANETVDSIDLVKRLFHTNMCISCEHR